MSDITSPPSSGDAVARRAPTAAARLSAPGSPRQRIGLVAGPAVAAVMLLAGPPEGLDVAAWRTAAVGVWMAVWWMSEALPIAATSLLPMLAFPVLGVAPIRDAAAPFANPLIFLFLGGFLIALALEDVGLHRRMALGILSAVGSSRRRVVLGFMLASAFLSLWISNTATAMMMMPIALSVITQVPGPAGAEDAHQADNGAGRFSLALLLGVAYACSVGGAATLIGTPTNALLAGYLLETYGYDISFAAW
ncbi:MAG: SLC13 family permease, partial [Acidobacteriota bacterium]